MSNTSTVTPYESDGGANNTTATAVADLIAWLADTDDDRAVDKRAQQARDRQLVKDVTGRHAATAVPIVSIDLHMKKAESLLKSVASAGYKIVQEVPRANTGFVVLQGMQGDRIVVEQSHAGGVRLHAAHSRATIDGIMRRHTWDRTMEHLSAAGFQVKTRELPNGEVQLLARGPSTKEKEEVHAQIRKDGSSTVDVVEVHGPHCMEIVNGLAAATGGRVTETEKKEEFYLLPGRLRRERVRLK